MRPVICFFLCFSLLAFNQIDEDEKRVEKGTQLFRAVLIEHFIHPRQLDKHNWKHCVEMIRNLVEKKEEDFVEIRIERAFKRSSETNLFRPVFIYADRQVYPMPAFKIMQ